MNLTFLQSIETRNFLLSFLRVGNKQSISVDVKLFPNVQSRVLGSRTCRKRHRRETYTHHPRNPNTQVAKNRRSPFWNWKFSSHSIACSHTHTHSRKHMSVMRQHELDLKRNGVGQCDVMEILVIAGVCLCVCERALGFENNGYTHVTFPSRNGEPNKRQHKKKNGVRVQCFRFALGSPHPIDPSSHRRAIWI